MKSEYKGEVKIGQKGILEDFIEEMKKYVVPHSRLMILFAVGHVGIIRYIANLRDTSIILNICPDESHGNTSSMGKSLATLLSTIPFGYYDSMVFHSTDTDNALDDALGESKFLSLIVDDKLAAVGEQLPYYQRRTVVKFIFRFDADVTKRRYKDTGKRYYGPLILSTESSLVDKMKGSESSGAFHRLIELACKKGELTVDASHADKIEKLLSNYYGFGECFIQHIMTVGKEEIEAMYYAERAELKKHVPESRYANRLALIIITAMLVNEAYGFDSDIEQIRTILLESVNRNYNAAKLNTNEYHNMYSYIQKNSDYFASSPSEYDENQHIGVFHKNSAGHEEAIIPSKNMSHIFSGAPASQLFSKDPKVKGKLTPNMMETLRDWRDNKRYLTSGKQDKRDSRLTSKQTLGTGKGQQHVYVVHFEGINE